eukprot:m.713131 g.713131  ORF g.713131 m.713131 type:complete len:138 (-) comp22970_c0_seq5:1863-2276(-)
MPKKPRGKEKRGGQSEASMKPLSTNPGDIVDRALAKLNDVDESTMEVAKSTILESLPELQDAHNQKNLQSVLRDMLEGVGVDGADDAQIESVAEVLETFHLGMGNPLVKFTTSLGTVVCLGTIELYLVKHAIYRSTE